MWPPPYTGHGEQYSLYEYSSLDMTDPEDMYHTYEAFEDRMYVYIAMDYFLLLAVELSIA